MCDASLDSTVGGAVGAGDRDYVRCANFNQDFTSLCLGTVKGYQIFDFTKDDDLQQLCNNRALDTQGSTTNCVIVQRLYSSSLVAVVSEDHPRKLCVNHFKKNSHICNYTYLQSILAVLLNRERLVVVCEDRLSIHVVKDMELIHNISDTPHNPSGLCALANSTDNCYLAYPASSTQGIVQVFDAYALKSVVQIPAHDSALQCMAFNDAGTKLATASVKGTVIRVFEVLGEQGQSNKLYELRRGMSRSATIYSLTFSLDTTFLLASSNTATIHVFRLQPTIVPQEEQSSYVSSMYSMINSAVAASAAYLPSQVAGIMVQERAFAWAALPSEGHNTKVAITRINKTPRVVVATADGMVYMYDINIDNGGECKLIRQHNLCPSAPTDEQTLERAVVVTGGASSVAGSTSTANTSTSSSPPSDAERAYAMHKAVQPPPVPALALDDPEQFPPV